MNEAHLLKIAQELGLSTGQIQATADVLDGGATVSFIFRYRKEATGSLEEAIRVFAENLRQLRSREALKHVPRLGPKAFEQASGFLCIRDGENPLDGSAVHPESYRLVDAMARDLGCTVADLLRDEPLRSRIDLTRYVSEKAGLPTLQDILAELSRPGRDPREQFEAFRFADGVEKIEDLRPGMKLPGLVTNITAFGAFVDVGVHQDGLVHVSELADRFVKNPAEVVKVHQQVTVTVLVVDLARKRISLSLKSSPPKPGAGQKKPDKTMETRRPGKEPPPQHFFKQSLYRRFREKAAIVERMKDDHSKPEPQSISRLSKRPAR